MIKGKGVLENGEPLAIIGLTVAEWSAILEERGCVTVAPAELGLGNGLIVITGGMTHRDVITTTEKVLGRRGLEHRPDCTAVDTIDPKDCCEPD